MSIPRTCHPERSDEGAESKDPYPLGKLTERERILRLASLAQDDKYFDGSALWIDGFLMMYRLRRNDAMLRIMMQLPVVAMMRCLLNTLGEADIISEGNIIGTANIICRRQTSFKIKSTAEAVLFILLEQGTGIDLHFRLWRK